MSYGVNICDHPDCVLSGYHPGPCQGLPTANPWAASSPDCPAGHHSRRVYRWSYDRDDPLPWFCADCLRRFLP